MNKTSITMMFAAALGIGVVMPGSANAQTSPTKTVRGPFEVVISHRGNPFETPLALVGMLTLNVDPSGSFTGVLTTGKDKDGNDLPAILFHGPNLPPDPSSANSYNVYGQITGRSVSILFDLGNNKYIIGSGVSKADLSAADTGDLSFAGGAAVGTDSGDSGDWGTFLSTSPPPKSMTTCTTVSLFGIEIYQSCTTVTSSGD